jgi:hypothetical protein
MLDITMRKSPVAAKTPHASTGSKKRARVKEQEQLYLVRKSGNGARSNGFRHHRPKEKRADAPKPFPFEWVDLSKTEMEYSSVLTRVSREYDRRFA